MPRPLVLLFDIDGTLVSGAVGRHAVSRAFARLYDRADACAALRFDGMTDRSITRLGLEAIGVPATEAAIDALLSAYLEELRTELSATPGSYRLYPGVTDALDACAQSGAAVGLGTGNIQEGARLKLEHVDIYRYFRFGGFGSDHELRVEIVRRGAERGAARLGAPLAECRVVVVGDTPKDIDAAKGIGAEAIGVGTGRYSAQQLLEHGATHAFADLRVPEALSALLRE